MKKIIVIGCPGAGKTTFSNILGQKLNIKVHHLDKYFWKENWTPTPQEDFRKIVIDLMKEDEWILDGNFKRSVEDRIKEADTVILFDFSKIAILWRILKRFFRYINRVRPEMGGNNKEALKWVHIKYILRYPRAEYCSYVTKLALGKKVVVLRNQKEVNNFLSSISFMELNCIIIHGSPRSPAHWVPIGDKKRWITWIKNELEKKGIKAYTPNMPVPWQPVYKDWKEEFEKFPVNNATVLIGHSAGGAFLPRWLGESKKKIKKLILVAPGKNIGTYPNAEHNKELYDFEIDPLIKDLAEEIIIFTSPEEPPHRQKNVLLYKGLLDAKVVSLPGKGHFTFDEMKTDEFPELLDIILS